MIALTIERETMKTAADMKAGRHRAESHNSSGNNSSIGIRFPQGLGSKKITAAIPAATTMSAVMPSRISRRGGNTRTTDASPMIKGATVMMPIPSDANQFFQVMKNGTSGLWNSLYPMAPPTPEAAVAIIAADSSHTT